MSGAVESGRNGLDRAFVVRVLFVVAVLVAVLVVWRLLHVLLLLFGAVLVAVLLHAVADPLQKRLGLRRRWALVAAVLIVAAVIGAAGWLFGSQVVTQVSTLAERLPAAWEMLRTRIAGLPIGAALVERIDDLTSGNGGVGDLKLPDVGGGLVSGLTTLVGSLVSGAVDLLVVVAAGLYLAGSPHQYRDGLLRLVPTPARPRAGEAFDAAADGLKRWLIGTLACMAVVGVLTGLGAWAIGLPSPLALGLLAGLLEFVPLIGPTLSVVPGLLLALNLGPQAVLWTLAVYVGVQQLESNLIVPLVQKRMIALPPVLTLFAVVSFAVLFGPIGVLFATPLAATLFVIARTFQPKD